MMQGTKPRLRKAHDALTKTPSPPKWLNDDAKAEWKRVAPALVDRQILTKDNFASLEHYCLAVAKVREMQRVIYTEGDFTQSEGGMKRKHPAHNLQKEALQESRLLAAELGLTPVSRSRPSIAASGEDEFDELLD